MNLDSCPVTLAYEMVSDRGESWDKRRLPDLGRWKLARAQLRMPIKIEKHTIGLPFVGSHRNVNRCYTAAACVSIVKDRLEDAGCARLGGYFVTQNIYGTEITTQGCHGLLKDLTERAGQDNKHR